MRKFCIHNIISLLALCFTTTAFAQNISVMSPFTEAESQIDLQTKDYLENAFVVYQTDGYVTGFAFSDKPVLSYSGENLVVTTNSITVQYPLAMVSKIVVEGKWQTVTGIEETTIDTHFSFSDEGANVRGEKPGTPFYVFDMKGSKISQGTIDAEGKANIRLSSLPSGIYIVKTQSTSFKIKK